MVDDRRVDCFAKPTALPTPVPVTLEDAAPFRGPPADEGSFISYGAYLLEAPVKRGFAGRCMEILLANVKRVLVKLRG